MTFADVQELVAVEFRRGVSLHGDWSDYTIGQMMAVIINELIIEAGDAECRGDIDGEHGVIRELTQVSACCNKAVMVLSDRLKGHLAETVRTEGANLENTGRDLPPSPPSLEDKVSFSNHPINRAEV